MARPLRIEFPDATYHVTVRGDRQEPIYLDDHDRRLQLDAFAQAAERHDATALAWCQMGNHVHWVIRTRRANLSRLMRQANGVYAQAFNRRHRVTGHLFQGRYHAIVVDHESYLLAVCRYVERNPVAAGLVAHAVDWPWSSCRAQLGLEPAPTWLDVDVLRTATLGRTPADDHDAALAILRHAEGLGDDGVASLWSTGLRRRIYLGDEAFVQRSQQRVAPARRLQDPEIPRVQRRTGPEPIEWSHPPGGRRIERDRHIAAAVAQGRTLRDIANQVGLSCSQVSRIARGRLAPAR